MAELQILDNIEQDDLEISDEDLAKQVEMLDKLGMALSDSRSTAIEFRSSTNIETEWTEDKEHYEGIDDANRGEIGSWSSKPPGQGVLGGDDETGSTVFFNITRPYCDIASAKVGDMLLPVDDKGWAINPTPIPDMVSIAGGELPYRIEKQIRSQVPEDQVESKIAEVIEQEKGIVEEAKAKAKRAEKRIADWHVECQYNAEMRMVIEDASQIGTGIMKGPIPENKRRIAFVNGELIEQDELQPVSRRVQANNCYPNPSCGPNIQDGSDHWEKDDISEKAVQDLKDQDGYIKEQIDKVLKEGPFQAVKAETELDIGDQVGLARREKSKLYQIWYYYGRLKKEDLVAAGLDLSDDEEIPNIDVHLVMINNRVIRGAPNHLSNGDFPYDYMVWQARAGSPFGIGIARQIRIPQRIINGAGRNLMDNAGLAGGPMWVVNQGLVYPLDGIWEIAPRKGWGAGEDAEDDSDISNAFSFVKMDMLQEDLQAIIRLGMNFAEYISGLPSLLQGQQQDGEATLGERQMQRNDGSTVLRRIARMYDDKITTPHLRRYYNWILMYGSPEEQGDFTIQARGSSALVERDINNRSIMDLGSLVGNPIYGLDPKRWAEQYLKSQKLDYSNFDYEDEDWKQLVEQMGAPQPDSSVEVATIRGQVAQMQEEGKTQREQFKIQNENQQKDAERMLTVELRMNETELRMVEMQYTQSGSDKENLDKIKADLAIKILELKAQLSVSADGTGPQVTTPAFEPEGRARDDRAYQE